MRIATIKNTFIRRSLAVLLTFLAYPIVAVVATIYGILVIYVEAFIEASKDVWDELRGLADGGIRRTAVHFFNYAWLGEEEAEKILNEHK